MNDSVFRPTWLEVNLDAISHNIKQIKKHAGETTSVLGVIKSDAYGHGAVMTARVLEESECVSMLAVAFLAEAIELRLAGIKLPILILGYVEDHDLEYLLKYNLQPTISTLEQAKKLSALASQNQKVADIQIKVDSGMGRLGFLPRTQSYEDVLAISKLPSIHISGMYTHFSAADEPDPSYTHMQFDRFMEFKKNMDNLGVDVGLLHCSNSPAQIEFPQYALDMVRAGIIIYGLWPAPDLKKNDGFKTGHAVEDENHTYQGASKRRIHQLLEKLSDQGNGTYRHASRGICRRSQPITFGPI